MEKSKLITILVENIITTVLVVVVLNFINIDFVWKVVIMLGIAKAFPIITIKDLKYDDIDKK